MIRMELALHEYAEGRNGQYPDGQSCAEASLSLLYKEGLLTPYMLRGKSVPEKKVRDILERGDLLDAESCGWHYVPGLSENDNPGLAILWDKVGLGHNGERTLDGSREVLFVGGGIEYIRRKDWAQFLVQQEKLLRERPKEPVLTATILFPNGNTNFSGSYTLELKGTGRGMNSPSFQRGSFATNRTCFIWYDVPWREQGVTNISLSLTTDGFTSETVFVSCSDTECRPDRIVLRMQVKRERLQ